MGCRAPAGKNSADFFPGPRCRASLGLGTRRPGLLPVHLGDIRIPAAAGLGLNQVRTDGRVRDGEPERRGACGD